MESEVFLECTGYTCNDAWFGPSQIEKVATYRITEDINGSDVGGANCCHGEEAMLPLAGVDCAFVHVEQTLAPACNAWMYTEQFAYKRNQIT